MGEVLLGCSGWNYPDTVDKGGWTGVFYPDKDTKRLRYYSQYFNTAEMDSTFYERLNKRHIHWECPGQLQKNFSSLLKFQKLLRTLND